MYTLIGYSSGIVVEAILLSTERDRILLAASGFSDALELTRSNGQWFTEAGEAVELEFLLAPAATVASLAAAAPPLLVRAAS